MTDQSICDTVKQAHPHSQLVTEYTRDSGGYPHFGVEGWRLVFLTVGIIGFALVILTWVFAHDPC